MPTEDLYAVSFDTQPPAEENDQFTVGPALLPRGGYF
jgi:hypothetical protein